MDITKVKTEENKSTYLLHRINPKDTEQFTLYGKQSSVDRRIAQIRHITVKRDFLEKSQFQGVFRKQQAKAQGIKAITLFLMNFPDTHFRTKTECLLGVKAFADKNKIKVSVERLRELYPLFSGLVK